MRWLLCLVCCCAGCLTSRLERPHIVATVLDASGQPLAGVEVITSQGVEAVTNATGRFELPARTCSAVTWPGTEAPPVHLSFLLQRQGYQPLHFQSSSPRAGGSSADVTWALEPLQLQSRDAGSY